MKKVIIGLVLLLSSIILGSVYLYQQAQAPYADARQDTIAYLSERTDLKQPQEFYWYNGTETTVTVKGLSDTNEEKLYIVEQQGGDITTFMYDETFSEQEAIAKTREAKQPEKILNAKIGKSNNTPIWEVTYKSENNRLGYYIMDLQTGEWIRTLENI